MQKSMNRFLGSGGSGSKPTVFAVQLIRYRDLSRISGISRRALQHASPHFLIFRGKISRNVKRIV